MKPLSRNKRRMYFIFFCIAFFIGAPFFIMDARGYRLNWSGVLKISQTGGLSISTDQSGMEIYVNNELVKKTSIFQRGYFAQFKPGVYEITVSKDGLQSWNKTLKVYPEMVTGAHAFLLRSNPQLVEISKTLKVQGADATSSVRSIPSKNPEYDLINALFLPPVAKIVPAKVATTSSENQALSDVVIKNEAGKLHVLWMGAPDSIPSYFCENLTCKSEITIDTASRVLSFDFFPGKGDLLILRTGSGIYASEIDDRSSQNIQTIASGAGYDFRVKDGKTIYLRKDGKIYTVSL